jgi:5'(3')-deoxyribonucleotidase
MLETIVRTRGLNRTTGAAMDATFVLGVDLDGTCADFYGGLRPIAAEWLGVEVESLTTEVSWNLPEWGVADAPGGYRKLHQFAVTQRDLFRNLKPMPGAPLVLRRLSAQGIRIRIITHRLFIKYFHRVAVQQTIDWLDGHDIPYWDLCFLADKAGVGADLYIDDSPTNVEQLRVDGHRTIVFSNSTNRHLAGPRVDTWDQAYDLILLEFNRWREVGASKRLSEV